MGKISKNFEPIYGKVSQNARTIYGKIGEKFGKRDQPRFRSALEYQLKQEIKVGSENEKYWRMPAKTDRSLKKRLETGAPLESGMVKPKSAKVLENVQSSVQPTWEATSPAEISVMLPEQETKIGRPPKSKISEAEENFTGSKIGRNPFLNKLETLLKKTQDDEG